MEKTVRAKPWGQFKPKLVLENVDKRSGTLQENSLLWCAGDCWLRFFENFAKEEILPESIPNHVLISVNRTLRCR